jgi:hypothetical protein
MSLATKLLRNVKEAKKASADEMSIPTYDNMHTPDNHVSGTAGATTTVKKPESGLGDRKDKRPTANVGKAGKERRDTKGVKGVKIKENIANHPAVQALGIGVDGGLLQFHDPRREDAVYSIPWNQQSHKFLYGMLNSSQEPMEVFQALEELYQDVDVGTDPLNRVGLAASVGESAHKTADGEMNRPAIGSGNPAKVAKLRSKQDDEPTNKGDSGTSKEEKGAEKKQFTMTPKDYKGGENEHKSMKKMHENIASLENLLGRKLKLDGVNKRTK